MKYVKEELEKLILEENLSYEEIGREYKVSGTYIKKISRRLGISLPIRQIFPDGFVPFNKGKVKVTSSEGTIIRTGKNKGTIYKIPEPVFCINCHIQCDTFAKKFCCKKCQDEYLSNEKYKEFLEDNGKYCTDVYIPKLFKRYFLSEQENKCDICKMENIWNSKPIVFVMDHIDGNAANNKRDNLRLVCPNCDSQLDTFKSKNKNSARKQRYLLNYKNLKLQV